MWWFDTTGDGYYDSDLRKTADGYIYLMSGNAYHTGAIQQYQSLEQMNSIAESIASGTASGIAQYTMGTTYEHGNEQYYHQYASDSGATIETMGQEQEEFFGEQDPTTPIGEVEGYGMPAQTSESLLGMDEASLADYLIQTKYGGTLPPNFTYDELLDKVREYFPQAKEQDITKTGFYAEQYGGATQLDDPDTPEDESLVGKISFAESITGIKAGQQRQQDMYGLQESAVELGEGMQGVYGGGMGTGIRTSIKGGEDIKKGVGLIEDQYGLTKETADLTYRQKIYGLEEEKEKRWEDEFRTFYENLPSATGG